MDMKRFLYTLLLPVSLLALAACDTFDDETPSFDRSVYERDTVATDTNTTIAQVKTKYKAAISSSSYQLVKEDLVFAAYVIGNDVSGNLYQTLVLRDGDDAITISINKTSLWVNFPVGTHVTVNLNGMYVGGYGKMAKIGMPYKNSNGNIRLSGIPAQLLDTNIKIIGYDETVPETTPQDVDAAWLDKADKDQWSSMLISMKNVQIKGLVVNGERRAIFAKYSDSDASSGNGVNDTIYCDGKKYILRTSTLCDFASDTIPAGTIKEMRGILTRYNSTWQVQLRSLDDIMQ